MKDVPRCTTEQELSLHAVCETSHYHEARFNLCCMAEKNVTDISTAALQKFEACLHAPIGRDSGRPRHQNPGFEVPCHRQRS